MILVHTFSLTVTEYIHLEGQSKKESKKRISKLCKLILKYLTNIWFPNMTKSNNKGKDIPKNIHN